MTGICSAHQGHEPSCPRCAHEPLPDDAITAAEAALADELDWLPPVQIHAAAELALEAAAPALRAQGAATERARIRSLAVDNGARVIDVAAGTWAWFADLLDGTDG